MLKLPQIPSRSIVRIEPQFRLINRVACDQTSGQWKISTTCAVEGAVYDHFREFRVIGTAETRLRSFGSAWHTLTNKAVPVIT